ncbi:MAG: hypothetical protein QM438_10175 [Euryarchaeota archaeon]|nr:hypothetical protein [Euryarchaeota archaeon]
MSDVAIASINTFGPSPKADFESPSEQLIVLTYAQLQDLIKGAIEQAIQPLHDEVAQLREEIDQDRQEIAALRLKMASLETALDQEITRVCIDIAYDRKRLAKLENPIKEPGKAEASRAEKIERYLAARPDHRANFETLRGHLGIDKDLLNDAIKALMASSPGRYGIVRASGDKRKRALVMLPK